MPPSMYLLWSLQKFSTLPRNKESVFHSVLSPKHLKKFQHYQEYPMSLAVIQAAALITDIPELHDRLIAGTARLLDLELMTNDPTIQASTFVRTVW